MVECSYCGDPVAMPYTCRLCNSKFCGKHRLPEGHDCVNIGIYDTQEYRIQKISKMQEHRAIKTADSFEDYSGAGGYSRFGQPWTTGDKNKDIVVGGMVLGLLSMTSLLIFGGLFVLIYLPFTMFFGVIFVFLLYYIRNYGANQYGMSTGVTLFPIGIALSFILAIFGRPWPLIGRFNNQGSTDLEKEAKVVLYMVFGSLAIYFLGSSSIFLFGLDDPNSSFIYAGIAAGILATSSMFVIIAILTMLPIWGMEGTILYTWNPRNYFITLALVILSFALYFTTNWGAIIMDIIDK
ncbi:MAG: AN1-type zinc finger domain-containing protein [Candidatus Kariarchaeaceae archaeon]